MLAGERRDNRKEMIDDINDVDFISGLERAQFESINLDFDEFRVTYHDLRNYLYYTIYLHVSRHGKSVGKSPAEPSGAEAARGTRWR